jgi:predicted nucleic acid-binding protein
LIPAPFQVVLDANVMFPYTLRDTLLRAAEQDLYLLGWSAEILEEMRRNLVTKGITTEEKSRSLVQAIQEAFPEGEITGYEYLIPAMPNDPKDRHVAAAAVRAGAQLIVTENLKDFRKLPDGLEVKTADAFLCDLFHLAPDLLLQTVIDQAGSLRRPPRTVEDVLRGLGKFAPKFVANLRTEMA